MCGDLPSIRSVASLARLHVHLSFPRVGSCLCSRDQGTQKTLSSKREEQVSECGRGEEKERAPYYHIPTLSE